MVSQETKRRRMGKLEPLQRDRERKVVEIVRSFLLAVQTFRRHQEKYRQGSLCFPDLAKLVDDRGQSILFILKESCHSLFRHNEHQVSEKEQIFDLTVGTLFHLAMKMREDLYQLEFYGPKYTKLDKKEDSPLEQKNLVHQFKQLISRADKSFQEGMDEVAILLQEALPQFQEFLGEHRENGLLIRFLLEEKDLLKDILGEGTLEDLFKRLYGPRPAQPYWLAGESYFQSGFYGRAAQAFSLAVEKNPADQNLLFAHRLSQALEQFYSFAPQQALKSLEKCLSLSAGKEVIEKYRAVIYMICQKIQEELPGRRKGDQHREMVKKAKALHRQMEKLALLVQDQPGGQKDI